MVLTYFLVLALSSSLMALSFVIFPGLVKYTVIIFLLLCIIPMLLILSAVFVSYITVYVTASLLLKNPLFIHRLTKYLCRKKSIKWYTYTIMVIGYPLSLVWLRCSVICRFCHWLKTWNISLSILLMSVHLFANSIFKLYPMK